MDDHLVAARDYMLRDFRDREVIKKEVHKPPYAAYDTAMFEHVVDGCESIVYALAGQRPPGGFIDAVLRNDLMEAFRTADATNTAWLWSYVRFIYWTIPTPLRHAYKEAGSWEKYRSLFSPSSSL